MKHLHTGQFKQVYKEVKTPLPHVNFLILGFLVWLEQHYLDYTIKANVDSAIKDYLKNDKNLWSRYTSCTGRVYPIASRSIIQHLRLSENRESHESNCNKDALDTVDQCVSPSVGVPVLRLSRLTLMCDSCDSNNMCGTDNISWQSQLWTAIIVVYKRKGDSKHDQH